ncbi:MAG: ATP-binding protein, partial [Acidobacteriota bacterium]
MDRSVLAFSTLLLFLLHQGAAAQPLSLPEAASLFDGGMPSLEQAFSSADGQRRIELGLLLADMTANERNNDALVDLLERLPPADEIERDFGADLATYARSLACTHQIRSGQIDAARAPCELVFERADTLVNPLLRSRVHSHHGLLEVRSGQLRRAVEPSQQSLSFAIAANSRYAQAAALNSIALTQLFGGLHDEAIDTFEQMRETAQGLHSTSILDVMEFNRGLAHMEAEDYDAAVESFRSGLEWTEATGKAHQALLARAFLARAHLARKEPQLARDLLTEVVTEGSEGHDPGTYALVLDIWARTALAEGRAEEALATIEAGLELVAPAENRVRRAQLLLARSDVLAESKEPQRALEVAQQIVAEHRAGEVSGELDDALERVSELAAELGLFQTAFEARSRLDRLEQEHRGARYELGVALLERNHALANAQRDLELIKGKQEKEAALRQRNTSGLAGLAAVVGLLVLAGSLNRSRREQHRIAEQQRELKEEFEGLVKVRTEALEIEMLQRMRGEEQRRELEKQLAEADKLRAIGQLTGGIAHDFNNLLTVVTSASEMLADEPDMPDDERMELIAAIRRAADSGRDVNRGLLAYARQQPLEPEPIPVTEHLATCRRLFERTLGDEMTLEMDCGTESVLADRGKFTTALINLLLNARDASSGRGKVILRANTLSNGLTEIDVIDHGQGMTQDELDRATEPFYSTKTSTLASGLGLSMVFGFVRQSGGDLQIRSQPGEGTTVTLELPTAEIDLESEAPESRTTEVPKGLRVLLVDDS